MAEQRFSKLHCREIEGFTDFHLDTSGGKIYGTKLFQVEVDQDKVRTDELIGNRDIRLAGLLALAAFYRPDEEGQKSGWLVTDIKGIVLEAKCSCSFSLVSIPESPLLMSLKSAIQAQICHVK